MSTMTLYGKTPINMMGGETAGETKAIDWLSDTIMVALVKSTYTPAQDTDELWADISANEVGSGNGYTTGGNVALNTAVTYVGASNTTQFDADDPAIWTASGAGFSFRYIVTYDLTSDILIGYNDYGSTLTLNPGDTFAFTFDAAGVFQATVA